MEEYTLSCADGRWILEGVASTELSSPEKSEIVREIMLAMPNDCDWDDYYPGESTR